MLTAAWRSTTTTANGSSLRSPPGMMAASTSDLRLQDETVYARSSDRRVLHGWRRRVRAMMTEVNVVDVDRGLARFRSAPWRRRNLDNNDSERLVAPVSSRHDGGFDVGLEMAGVVECAR
jgi:hypothetical protein